MREYMDNNVAVACAAESLSRSGSLESAVFHLVQHCRQNDWAGFDPYDALNSRLFARTPFSRSRLCRIAFIQALKRLPINPRRFLGIGKEENPKAIALFLKAFLILARHGLPDGHDVVRALSSKLQTLRSEACQYSAWG